MSVKSCWKTCIFLNYDIQFFLSSSHITRLWRYWCLSQWNGHNHNCTPETSTSQRSAYQVKMENTWKSSCKKMEWGELNQQLATFWELCGHTYTCIHTFDNQRVEWTRRYYHDVQMGWDISTFELVSMFCFVLLCFAVWVCHPYS